MKHTSQMPDRDAFRAFWTDESTRSWGQAVWYGLYIGILLLYTLVIRHIDPAGWFGLLSFAIAVVYAVLTPFISLQMYWRRRGPFIRCPQCGDWFGQDMSGAWSGPNPRWVTVCQTGHCVKCGKQILLSAERPTVERNDPG